MQVALRFITQWCTYWKLSFRPNKCHAINLSKRYTELEFNFSINSGLIDLIDEIKAFDFYVARSEGFRKQTDYRSRKMFSGINIRKSLAMVLDLEFVLTGGVNSVYSSIE